MLATRHTLTLTTLALAALWTASGCGDGSLTINTSGQQAAGPNNGRGNCPSGTNPVASFHYDITRNGQTFTVPTMRDNLQQGDHVEVEFTIAQGCEDVQLTLASYTAPSNQDGTELQQDLYDHHSGIFDAGTHRLQMDLPDCYFQTDFAYGPVIDDVQRDGVYGSRNIDSDVGGTTACGATNPPPDDNNNNNTGACAGEGKVGVCHNSGSGEDPWEFICVDASSLADHAAAGDVINISFAEDCPNG